MDEKLARGLKHLIEPDLLNHESMWRVLDDGEIGINAEFLHALAKFVSVSAGIVFFAAEKPAGRVVLVEVGQRRGKAIRRGLFLLRSAEELLPDFCLLRFFAVAFRHEITLGPHGHCGLNCAAGVGIASFAFEFFDPT